MAATSPHTHPLSHALCHSRQPLERTGQQVWHRHCSPCLLRTLRLLQPLLIQRLPSTDLLLLLQRNELRRRCTPRRPSIVLCSWCPFFPWFPLPWFPFSHYPFLVPKRNTSFVRCFVHSVAVVVPTLAVAAHAAAAAGALEWARGGDFVQLRRQPRLQVVPQSLGTVWCTYTTACMHNCNDNTG